MNACKALRKVLPTATILAAGCGGMPVTQIELMPAPEVYEAGNIDPFVDNDPISNGALPGVLYATDRAPAPADDGEHDYYGDERGNVLRLGLARIRLGIDETVTWEEARQISLLKNRTESYPLEIATVREFGPLDRTVRAFDDNVEPDTGPGRLFADEIDRNLARSGRKDVYIYVHGYKVVFDNPVLVAAELWHFLGYQGAFVAYSWPSTPRRLAYMSDLEDAVHSGRNLRELILHIAGNTDVEQIHVIGYSAGTRVVTRMLGDLGMYGYLLDPEDVKRRVKLGNVILVGSDVDQQIMAGYLLDGALRVPDSLTIYQSSSDKALGLSRFVFKRSRTGQTLENMVVGPRGRQFLEEHPGLRIIDVSNVEGADKDNGHSYFRSSPTVSSDILMTLMYDLSPGNRGLVQDTDGLGAWRFPEDYILRLREALHKASPRAH
jgi:esterase/lipase superfamily enzyme